MKRFASLAALVAVAVAVGLYFGTRGQTLPRVPKAQQNQILERARAEGVIRGYRVRRFDQLGFDYRIVGADIRFSSMLGLCGGGAAGRPQCLSQGPILFVEYRRPAASQAFAIQRIAQKQLPRADIKIFEVTNLFAASPAALHIPDTRIMLIPKAGS
jgi:hypothetical protein